MEVYNSEHDYFYDPYTDRFYKKGQHYLTDYSTTNTASIPDTLHHSPDYYQGFSDGIRFALGELK